MSQPVALVDTGASTRDPNEAKRVGTSAVGPELALKVDITQSVPLVVTGGGSGFASWPSTPTGPTTGAVTSVAANVATVTLLAANAIRITASVYNDSASALYIKSGAGASTSSFSVKVLPGGYFEVPSGYRGVLTAVWDTATGNARITEYTP
jgi:hypothetical protein